MTDRPTLAEALHELFHTRYHDKCSTCLEAIARVLAEHETELEIKCAQLEKKLKEIGESKEDRRFGDE